MFSQDDAHIFCEDHQIEEEYQTIFDICDRFYHLFGIEYRLRLGTRPKDSVGDDESWFRAEETLRAILDERTGEAGYLVEEGGGAFYGPKIDIMMYDALGRSWQMGTIQLDFQLPKRFNCTFVDSDNNKRSPVVIHRVIYGSIERFIGILIEHTDGAFPLWISPLQVDVFPVHPDHDDYAREVKARLRDEGVRSRLVGADTSLGARIRQSHKDRTPLALVVGGKEADARTVSVRLRGGVDGGVVGLEPFVEALKGEIDAKSLELDALSDLGTT